MAEIESRVFAEEFYAATKTALGLFEVAAKSEVNSGLGYPIEIESQEVHFGDKDDFEFVLRHVTYRGEPISDAVSEIVQADITSPQGGTVSVNYLPCDGTVITEGVEDEVNQQELDVIPDFIISAANYTHNLLQERLKDIASIAKDEYKNQYEENAELGQQMIDFQASIAGYDHELYQTVDMFIYELIGTFYVSIHVRINDDTDRVLELDMDDFELRTWVGEGDISDVTHSMDYVSEFSRLARILLS